MSEANAVVVLAQTALPRFVNGIENTRAAEELQAKAEDFLKAFGIDGDAELSLELAGKDAGHFIVTVRAKVPAEDVLTVAVLARVQRPESLA